MIQVVYKGTTLTQVPVTIDHKGHCIKVALSGRGEEDAQICHMWKTTKNGVTDRGTSSLDSTTDGTLEIKFLPEDDEELLIGDFIVLEHVFIFKIESEE